MEFSILQWHAFIQFLVLENLATKFDCSNPSGCRDMAIFFYFLAVSKIFRKKLRYLEFLNPMVYSCFCLGNFKGFVRVHSEVANIPLFKTARVFEIWISRYGYLNDFSFSISNNLVIKDLSELEMFNHTVGCFQCSFRVDVKACKSGLLFLLLKCFWFLRSAFSYDFSKIKVQVQGEN